LTQIKVFFCSRFPNLIMWSRLDTSTAVPPDREVRLAVIDAAGAVHALVFPCRRSGEGWVDAKTGRRVDVFPTHWQDWAES
jgi:hypothetical protein